MDSKALWIGFGCRRGCSVQALQALLQQVMFEHDLNFSTLRGMASIDLKAQEPGLVALAKQLGLPFATYDASTLAPYLDRLSHRSARSMSATGCWGVAESAALAMAEAWASQPSALWVPRHQTAQATVAIAGFGLALPRASHPT